MGAPQPRPPHYLVNLFVSDAQGHASVPKPVGAGAVEHRPFVKAEAAGRPGARGRGFDNGARVAEAGPTTGQHRIRIHDQPCSSVERLAAVVAPLCPPIVVGVLEDHPGPRVPLSDRSDAGPVVGEEEVDHRVWDAPVTPVKMVLSQVVDGGAVTPLPLPPQPLREHNWGGTQ